MASSEAQSLEFEGLKAVPLGPIQQKTPQTKKKRRRRRRKSKKNNDVDSTVEASVKDNDSDGAGLFEKISREDQGQQEKGDKTSNTKRGGKKRTQTKELKERMKQYNRGEGVETRGIDDKKLKHIMKRNEKMVNKATEEAARAEILRQETVGSLEAEGMERTWRFKQTQIRDEVDVRTAKKIFNLDLKFGPYCMDFTREGRYLLLGGKKGHLSIMEWQKFNLKTELHVQETIRDVTFLHDEKMFAVAQKKYVYIYDNSGIELHCLRNHSDVNCLEFLPYHFLMASVGKTGHLKYQDTSTGTIIAQHRTKLGECSVMVQNPRNAVLCLGHSNGTVTMWSPSMTEPLIKMLCHRAPVRAAGVSIDGMHLVTSGLDGRVKVWDLRTYKELHNYYSVRPASTINISQQGMLALGFGSHVHVWKDAFVQKQKSPYMVHELPGDVVRRVQFCPYEDILGISTSKGYHSVVIPGSGEPNFDTFEANPFATTKQARESLVVKLLDKLPPEIISIDSDLVGRIDHTPRAVLAAEKYEEEKKKEQEKLRNKKEKRKQRGRNSSTKRWRRKRSNVMDQRTADRQQKIAKIHNERKLEREDERRKSKGLAKDALARFRKI
mmetsp:Transcript_21111/g.51652  ORF Transcript_21111/g.51652 Transcript_21111/m.51652 type:complete len:608 (-) Transcript_21111:383-2206(-)